MEDLSALDTGDREGRIRRGSRGVDRVGDCLGRLSQSRCRGRGTVTSAITAIRHRCIRFQFFWPPNGRARSATGDTVLLSDLQELCPIVGCHMGAEALLIGVDLLTELLRTAKEGSILYGDVIRIEVDLQLDGGVEAGPTDATLRPGRNWRRLVAIGREDPHHRRVAAALVVDFHGFQGTRRLRTVVGLKWNVFFKLYRNYTGRNIN